MRAGDGLADKGAKSDEATRAWHDARDPVAAQAAGKKILKELPDDAASLEVVLKYVKEGWPVPRLATSYAVLRSGAFDKVEGRDGRLARAGAKATFRWTVR